MKLGRERAVELFLTGIKSKRIIERLANFDEELTRPENATALGISLNLIGALISRYNLKFQRSTSGKLECRRLSWL